MQLPESVRRNLVLLAVLGLLFAFLVVENPRLLLFFVAITVTAGFTVFEAKYDMPIEISPVFFFALIITNYLGLGYTLAFIILGAALPAVQNGRGKDVHLFIQWCIMFVLCIVSTGIFQGNIAGTGIVMSVVECLVSSAVQILIGMLAGVVLLRTVSFLIINLFYFLALWNLWLRFVLP